MSVKLVKTRSERLADLSALDHFFKQSKTDADTFYDAIKEKDPNMAEQESHHDSVRRLIKGSTDVVKTPKKMREYVSGYVRIICGWHRDDFVWHIEPAAIRRPWKITNAQVIQIIARVMHSILPDIEAKIWPPASDWELRTITFKALDLMNQWNFNDEDIEKINNKLFAMLNPFV